MSEKKYFEAKWWENSLFFLRFEAKQKNGCEMKRKEKYGSEI
jgi:hypothetical protein